MKPLLGHLPVPEVWPQPGRMGCGRPWLPTRLRSVRWCCFILSAKLALKGRQGACGDA